MNASLQLASPRSEPPKSAVEAQHLQMRLQVEEKARLRQLKEAQARAQCRQL